MTFRHGLVSLDRAALARLGLVALSCFMVPRALLNAALTAPPDATYAYWTFRLGPDLYNQAAFTVASHEYPPIFAQFIAPFTNLPWAEFDLLWLTAQLALLLVLVGPRWLGVVLLLVPVQIALGSGNLTFVFIAVAVIGARYPAVWAIPMLTKITPGVGLLWFVVRREWRNLAVALGVTGALAALSIATIPDEWAAWLTWLRANAGVQAVGNAMPVPLWIRLPAAALVVAWGAWKNQPWVLAVPLWIGQPTAWWSEVVILGAPLLPWLRRLMPVPGVGNRGIELVSVRAARWADLVSARVSATAEGPPAPAGPISAIRKVPDK
jgi:hypothetical protein